MSSWNVPYHLSDSAVKQILLSMNEKDPFIIEDLDEFHVIIKVDEEYRVRRELETEVLIPFLECRHVHRANYFQLEKNTYSLEAGQ